MGFIGFSLGLLMIYLYIIALPIAIPATALVMTAASYFRYGPGLARVLMMGWCAIGTVLIATGSAVMYHMHGINWVGVEPHPVLFAGAIMMIPALWTLIFFPGD